MTTSALTTSDARLGSRRSAGDILESGRTTVKPALRAAVERLPAAMWPILGYHYGWLDEAGQPTDGGAGEALRPTTALLSARAVATVGRATGAAEGGAAVPAAVAVELVELAGGRIWCQDRAEQLLTRAESRLSTVAPESGPAADAVAELRTLARLLAHRDH